MPIPKETKHHSLMQKNDIITRLAFGFQKILTRDYTMMRLKVFEKKKHEQKSSIDLFFLILTLQTCEPLDPVLLQGSSPQVATMPFYILHGLVLQCSVLLIFSHHLSVPSAKAREAVFPMHLFMWKIYTVNAMDSSFLEAVDELSSSTSCVLLCCTPHAMPLFEDKHDPQKICCVSMWPMIFTAAPTLK